MAEPGAKGNIKVANAGQPSALTSEKQTEIPIFI
jgi:hypothetical protein